MRERREFLERYAGVSDKVRLESNIDYRRKRGMLEEINRAVVEAEGEEEEMRSIRERNARDRSVLIEPPETGDAPLRGAWAQHLLGRRVSTVTRPRSPCHRVRAKL